MRIISKQKDYYDWVAGMYGGGDPLVTYSRRPLTPDQIGQLQISPRADFGLYRRNIVGIDGITEYSCSLCVVAGIGYRVVRTHGTSPWKPWAVLSHDDQKLRQLLIHQDHVVSRYNKDKNKENPNSKYVDSQVLMYLPKKEISKSLLEASRILEAPVFEIHPVRPGYYHGSLVVEKIPNLAELGFPAHIPPEQMYQNISYFMGNLINPSPDLAPPVQVSNSNKILQHGFDLKTSFRH